MQDELFFLERCKKVAALAALPEGSPKREATIQRLWELARKSIAPWCSDAVDALSRDNPFAESKAGLLLGGLGVIVVLGMYGIVHLGVDPRLRLALGTLALIALAAGAALYAARYRRAQERDFCDRLDACLARSRTLPAARLAQLSGLFARPAARVAWSAATSGRPILALAFPSPVPGAAADTSSSSPPACRSRPTTCATSARCSPDLLCEVNHPCPSST